MSHSQPIAIFEEEQPVKKKYSGWAITAIIYCLVIQAVLFSLCSIGVFEGINSLGHFNYSASHIATGLTGEVISMLIEGKYLVAFWVVLTLLLSICARHMVGWVLAAINYYGTVAFLCIMLFTMHTTNWLTVFVILLTLAVQLLCLICFNRPALKRFYKIRFSKRMLLWNAVAVLGGLTWMVIIFYNVRF